MRLNKKALKLTALKYRAKQFIYPSRKSRACLKCWQYNQPAFNIMLMFNLIVVYIGSQLET